jgi:carbonic anhydrase/acetyltransferase-like protein (isoleucine patch superfamily)
MVLAEPRRRKMKLVDQVSIAESAFVAPSATVVGLVEVCDDASIWFQAVVRSESELIRIGPRSNVQDGVVVHVDEGFPVRIGAGVTIGHRAVIHGATVEDGALIGIGAILLNGAVIGAHSLVGAGALVTEGKVFPPRSLIIGSPARVVRPLRDDELLALAHSATHYVEAARAYQESLGDLI